MGLRILRLLTLTMEVIEPMQVVDEQERYYTHASSIEGMICDMEVVVVVEDVYLALEMVDKFIHNHEYYYLNILIPRENGTDYYLSVYIDDEGIFLCSTNSAMLACALSATSRDNVTGTVSYPFVVSIHPPGTLPKLDSIILFPGVIDNYIRPLTGVNSNKLHAITSVPIKVKYPYDDLCGLFIYDSWTTPMLLKSMLVHNYISFCRTGTATHDKREKTFLVEMLNILIPVVKKRCGFGDIDMLDIFSSLVREPIDDEEYLDALDPALAKILFNCEISAVDMFVAMGIDTKVYGHRNADIVFTKEGCALYNLDNTLDALGVSTEYVIDPEDVFTQEITNLPKVEGGTFMDRVILEACPDTLELFRLYLSTP